MIQPLTRGKIVNDYGTTNNGNLLKQTVYVPNNEANTSPTSWYQQYDYDSLNRLSRVREFNSSDTQLWKQTYIYDRYGNRTIDYENTTDGIPRPQFTVSTTNNRLGVPSGQSGTMSYDSAGNLTTDTYSAAAVTRVYDAENRMTQETQASSYVAGSYSYDGDGRRVKRVVGGVETWQVYGLGGELLAEYAANADDSSPQKEYGYRNGQLLVTVTCPTGGESITYTNNPLEAGTSLIKAEDITELRTAVNQARTHAGLSAATWTDSSLSGVQVKAVHVTELRTKLDEARAALGLSTVTWTDSSLSGVLVKAVHISELRTKAAETVTTVDIRWMVTDQLGTPRMMFDQTGSLANVSRHDHLPFGEELFDGTGARSITFGYTNDDAARQKFTQKERDNETGLDFFEARYYSSTQGRFTSPDPIILQEEMLTDPQRFNLYAYVRNTPLNLIDPKGEAIELTGDEKERQKKLDVLRKMVGKEAGAYLYENRGKDGKYFVGVYTNGPDGKGQAFEKLNAASGDLSGIINDRLVADIEFAQQGQMVQFGGRGARIGAIGTGGSPGASGVDEYGRARIFLLDPSSSPGNLPGEVTSDRNPLVLETSDVLAHELGHVASNWGLTHGSSEGVSLSFENDARKVRNPNSATRTSYRNRGDLKTFPGRIPLRKWPR